MGLGDPPQEPGSGGDPAPGDPAPGGGGEARKHPSTGDAPGKTGAQHWGRGTPDGRFSPSGRDTPEPLPALATSKLMVTGCSPSSSSTAEDTREVRDPSRPTVSTLEPRAGNPGANSLGNRGHSCEDRGLRGPGLQASPGPTLCFAPSGWACTLPQFPHLQRGTVSLPPRSSEVEPCTCGVSPATELAQGLPPATRPPPFLVREPGLQEAQPRVKVAAGGWRGRTPRPRLRLPQAPLDGSQDGRKSQATQPVSWSLPCHLRATSRLLWGHMEAAAAVLTLLALQIASDAAAPAL